VARGRSAAARRGAHHRQRGAVRQDSRHQQRVARRVAARGRAWRHATRAQHRDAATLL
jgi:hypothetical protein